MSNNILTHAKIAKEAAAMLLEKSIFIRSISRSREKEFAKELDGYKIGNSVKIKIPPVPVVTDGNVLNPDHQSINAQEEEVVLTVDTHKHVGLKFGVYERELDIADYKERFLKPAVNSLASVVDADILKRAINTVNNFTLQTNSEPHPLAAFGRVRGMMNRALSPDTDRKALLSSDFTNTLVDNSGTLFNPNAEIAKQYKEGYVGRARGFDFFESEHIWTLTNGSKVAGVTVNGAGQSGGLLAIGGLTAGDTIKAGQVFTIAGVNMIHPLTRQTYGKPMQFVVLEDFTAAGATGAIKIYPEIKPNMIGSVLAANANVTDRPDNSAALTFVGAAGAVVDQALCFDPHAFAAAFVPIGVIPNAEGYMFKADNFALTIQTGGNITNLDTDTRLDVLYGFKTVRGNHAGRVGIVQ